MKTCASSRSLQNSLKLFVVFLFPAGNLCILVYINDVKVLIPLGQCDVIFAVFLVPSEAIGDEPGSGGVVVSGNAV